LEEEDAMSDIPLSRRSLLTGAFALAAAGAVGRSMTGPAGAKTPMLGTQAPYWYRFKHGAFEMTVVSDGPLPLGEPSASFVGTTKEAIQKALADNFLPTDHVVLEQNALVVNTSDRLVLFDNGMGTSKVFGPTTGKLLASLKAAGLDPKDVTAICFTHAHIDHCWGTMADDGSRNFPNAQLYMAQNELEFWTDEGKLSGTGWVKDFVAGARKQLLPSRDRMVFVKDGQEILPGITALSTPGHTVGHTCYMITSHGKSICNIGDLTHHQVLLVETPRLEFAYDTDSKQSARTRVRTLDMLATDRIPLVAYHFPWPGIGHVAKHGDGFRYFPTPMKMVL
jgi:glyoxylase-like metal-dependent hydrolase (beta-lactamase superfamily II)